MGLLGPLEAILGPLWVYAGVGEAPSKWTLLGGAILISSLVAHEVAGCVASVTTLSNARRPLRSRTELQSTVDPDTVQPDCGTDRTPVHPASPSTSTRTAL